ncbi:hypothetical protein [Mycobacterium basiliense]|uniref:hypothetical protein n=1 Tax=Mycobacterium basiliense TaxID=2094119 RepID=UPI0013915B84|nr:hypothetical protein [Mycobacterium basiliense]
MSLPKSIYEQRKSLQAMELLSTRSRGAVRAVARAVTAKLSTAATAQRDAPMMAPGAERC